MSKPAKGIWDERTKTWIRPSGTVKQGRRPMFKPFNERTCPQCGGALRYYDGCLGYEALRCYACGYELDLNAKANAEATRRRLEEEK